MSQKQAVTDTVQEINPPDGFDTQRRFVRVTSHRADGFIEFDLARSKLKCNTAMKSTG